MQSSNMDTMKAQRLPRLTNKAKAAKNYKYSHLSSYKSHKYAEIGFIISKQNKKYVAVCRICNRTLGNTAYARLKGHRNICKLPTAEEECSEIEHITTNNETYLTSTNQIDSHPPECVSQSSTGDSRLTFNVVPPKIESVVSCGNYVDDPESSKPYPYLDLEQESQILDEENLLKLSMIEVLLLIKYNKQLLFTNTTKKSIDVWMKVLRKAQSLGLAPSDVPWRYARDSLYFAWRFHTQQKKDAIRSGEHNVNLNIVDLAIWQIESAPLTSESSTFGDEMLNDPSTVDRVREISDSSARTKETSSISTQTSDQMLKADLRLKQLQCEAMEIENYKRSLEVYELECKLKVPPSKHTVKYIPTVHVHLTQPSNGRCDDKKDADKIEIDDSD